MIRALNVAGLSEVEKRVVKATYDDDDPPKAKHVEALILLSADHDLLPYLDRRLISTCWNVACKTLILAHRLALEGDERFLAEMAASASSLQSLPASFDADADPTASAHSAFVHAYADYLQAKLQSFAAIRLSCERYPPAESHKWASRLSSLQLAKVLPRIQRQFDRLLLTAPRNATTQEHPIPIAAMSLCIKSAAQQSNCTRPLQRTQSLSRSPLACSCSCSASASASSSVALLRDAFRLYSVLTIAMLVVLGQQRPQLQRRVHDEASQSLLTSTAVAL